MNQRVVDVAIVKFFRDLTGAVMLDSDDEKITAALTSALKDEMSKAVNDAYTKGVQDERQRRDAGLKSELDKTKYDTIRDHRDALVKSAREQIQEESQKQLRAVADIVSETLTAIARIRDMGSNIPMDLDRRVIELGERLGISPIGTFNHTNSAGGKLRRFGVSINGVEVVKPGYTGPAQ